MTTQDPAGPGPQTAPIQDGGPQGAAPQTPGAPAAGAAEPIVLYRVRFRPLGETVADRRPDSSLAQGATRVLMHFDHPRPADAEVETLSGDSFVKLAQAPAREEETLLLFISDRAPDQEVWRREAEAWISGEEPGEFGPPLRAGVEGGWVLWRPGRAVVLAPPDRREEMLAAVADFAFHHGELGRLEGELSANWAELQADLPLVHKVGRKELRRREHVGRMTALTSGWRLQCARLEAGLAGPPSRLSPAGRRAGEKLRALARAEDRLERLDGQIEVYEYEYELINQRLSDCQHFRKELIAELVIVAILVVDMVLWVADFYFSYLAPDNGQ